MIAGRPLSWEFLTRRRGRHHTPRRTAAPCRAGTRRAMLHTSFWDDRRALGVKVMLLVWLLLAAAWLEVPL